MNEQEDKGGARVGVAGEPQSFIEAIEAKDSKTLDDVLSGLLTM